ncbi:uncharacterized protein TNCV_4064351 [Trichonephila clavipes]|nr:uncharacterized protein TNCV_4064351 [Trichonephila clavipes]
MRAHTITDVTQNRYGCEHALSRNIQVGTDHSRLRNSQKKISLHFSEEGGTQLLLLDAFADVKGSAWKGCLELRFASARCLEIVCGTIATPTSDRIVERVTVGYTSTCRTILRFSLLVVFLVASHPVFHAWVPSRVHCSQQFLMAHSERSTWTATWPVDQPAVFIPMIRPLSNSLNCKKCLLARLPAMFLLLKSSYNRRVIVTFMNLRICAGLYSTLFLIVAPPRCVGVCVLAQNLDHSHVITLYLFAKIHDCT